MSPSKVTGTLLPASGPTVTGGNVTASNALSLLFWKTVVLLQRLRISSLSTSIQSFPSNILENFSAFQEGGRALIHLISYESDKKANLVYEPRLHTHLVPVLLKIV